MFYLLFKEIKKLTTFSFRWQTLFNTFCLILLDS